SSNYNDNDKPSNYNNYDVPDNYEAFKEQQKAVLVFGDFSLTSLLLRQNDLGFFAFSDKLNYVLDKHDQNIFKTDDQNKKAKAEKRMVKKKSEIDDTSKTVETSETSNS
ncbi:45655_t:CDS:2, partial [Gigaspora margarita]